MKVKSESEVAQSGLTLRDPMDCSLPGSSVHGISQARVLEWIAIAFSNFKCSRLLIRVGGFPGGTSGKKFTCQYKRPKRGGFDPWVRKIPWKRAWQPTPVFLPGESHGWRSLTGYSPWGHKESDTTEGLTMSYFQTLLSKDMKPLIAFLKINQQNFTEIAIILFTKYLSLALETRTV